MSRIIFYPSGTRELPSSHLRVYEVADELQALGHSVVIVDPSLGDKDKRVFLELASSGTIVYIQKIMQSFHKVQNFLPFKNKFKLVYDVDDWGEERDRDMMEMAHIVVAGSHYIHDYAKQQNPNVHIALSITDTQVYHLVDRSTKSPDAPVQIIWTESFANAFWEDLGMIAGPMKKMYEKYKVRFVLQGLRENRHMSNKRYHNLLYKFIRFFPYCIVQKFMPIDQYLTKGVQTILDSDIGVIPFKPERVGKAGQNMRSFMSAGLGVIGTPNNEHDYLIEHGQTGFLATTEQEWEVALETLISNRQLRLEMGQKASHLVQRKYGRKQYMKNIQTILGI